MQLMKKKEKDTINNNYNSYSYLSDYNYTV